MAVLGRSPGNALFFWKGAIGLLTHIFFHFDVFFSWSRLFLYMFVVVIFPFLSIEGCGLTAESSKVLTLYSQFLICFVLATVPLFLNVLFVCFTLNIISGINCAARRKEIDSTEYSNTCC